MKSLVVLFISLLSISVKADEVVQFKAFLSVKECFENAEMGLCLQDQLGEEHAIQITLKNDPITSQLEGEYQLDQHVSVAGKKYVFEGSILVSKVNQQYLIKGKIKSHIEGESGSELLDEFLMSTVNQISALQYTETPGQVRTALFKDGDYSFTPSIMIDSVQ